MGKAKRQKKKQKGSIRLVTPEEAKVINDKDPQGYGKNKPIELKKTNKKGEETLGSRLKTAFTDKSVKPGKTGIKALDIASSPKTTLALGTTLATMGIGAAAAGAFRGAATAAKVGRPALTVGNRAVITRTATSIGFRPTTVTAQRAFVGRPGVSKVGKLFKRSFKNAAVNGRFATNAKSTGLTTSFIKRIGGTPTILGVIGSYPFAGFIKEEALQTLGFAANTAKDNRDAEGLENAIIEQEEILNPTVWEKLINAVPFANVVKQLRDFYEAARIKLENDKETLRQLLSDEPSAFAQEREAIDKAARQRALEYRAKDAEYYRLIREGKFEEAQKLLDTELEGGSQNE